MSITVCQDNEDYTVGKGGKGQVESNGMKEMNY